MNPNELHSIEALNQTNASEHLSEREKHLVGLAVTLTRGCIYCSGGRIEKALAAGIPQDTVTATVDLTAWLSRVPAMTGPVRQGIRTHSRREEIHAHGLGRGKKSKGLIWEMEAREGSRIFPLPGRLGRG